jgi:parallel beta-helix repeat protein
MNMSLTKINTKIVILLFIFAISLIFIFYSEINGQYPYSIGNFCNNSTDANIHSGDLIQKNVSNASYGDTVIVYPEDSIQPKINNVNSYGTVLVYPGIYKENLIVDKPLSIVSKQGKSADTVIQAANPEEDVFHITANNVTISGFNITGSQNKSGIYCSGSDSNITGNKLSYNMYGVYINNSTRNTLDNNEVNNNSFGIYLKASNNNQLRSNNVSGVGIFVGFNNEAWGIYLEDSNDNKLMSNSISGLWGGLNLNNSSNNELNNSSILDNYFSLILENSNNNKVLNNTIVKRGYSFSVVLAHSQNNTLKGNTAGPNTEIEVVYDFNSTNNILEGELYTTNEKGTGGVYRVK